MVGFVLNESLAESRIVDTGIEITLRSGILSYVLDAARIPFRMKLNLKCRSERTELRTDADLKDRC